MCGLPRTYFLGEFLALEASYGRSCLTQHSLRRVWRCVETNHRRKGIDGPLRGLDYRLERVGMRNRFERFFRYLDYDIPP
jgi:hypothetical protein